MNYFHYLSPPMVIKSTISESGRQQSVFFSSEYHRFGTSYKLSRNHDPHILQVPFSARPWLTSLSFFTRLSEIFSTTKSRLVKLPQSLMSLNWWKVVFRWVRRHSASNRSTFRSCCIWLFETWIWPPATLPIRVPFDCLISLTFNLNFSAASCRPSALMGHKQGHYNRTVQAGGTSSWEVVD